jgi:hypothetical protein
MLSVNNPSQSTGLFVFCRQGIQGKATVGRPPSYSKLAPHACVDSSFLAKKVSGGRLDNEFLFTHN